MGDLITRIQSTLVGKNILVLTTYMENLHDFVGGILEENGNDHTAPAEAIRDLRAKHKGTDALNDADGIPMFGPYYETTVRGGKHDDFSRRYVAVSQALAGHAETIAMVKESLVSDVSG